MLLIQHSTGVWNDIPKKYLHISQALHQLRFSESPRALRVRPCLATRIQNRHSAKSWSQLRIGTTPGRIPQIVPRTRHLKRNPRAQKLCKSNWEPTGTQLRALGPTWTSKALPNTYPKKNTSMLVPVRLCREVVLPVCRRNGTTYLKWEGHTTGCADSGRTKLEKRSMTPPPKKPVATKMVTLRRCFGIKAIILGSI